MKKLLFTIFAILLIYGAGFTLPVTGTFVIPGTLPAGYPTIARAIADLNNQGVGTGGVTFNVAANYAETFLTPNDGYITTTTSSLANPIVFQKSGSGSNPLVTSAAGKGNMDAIIAFYGCDYVTFNGIDLADNSDNATPDEFMEWGFAILKASSTDGSQNITIKNSTINLVSYYTGSIGIYSDNIAFGSFTPLTVTAFSGTNSNLKISGNTISNCYQGIYLKGYAAPAPYAFYDQNNEIGKEGPNLITNVGGGINEAYGLYTIYQNNLKVANNTVTSTTAGSKNIYGICLSTAINASYDMYGNTVSIQFTPTDLFGNDNFYPVYCTMGESGTTNVANIYNNTVTNCTFPTSMAAAATRCLYLLNMGVTANVYGNVVSNNTIGGDGAASTTGDIRYLWIQKASSTPGPLVVHDNSITGNARYQNVPGMGNTYFLAIAGSGTTLDAYSNIVNNNIVNTQGGTYCLYTSFADASGKTVYNNTVTNITHANGAVMGLYNTEGTLGRFYNNKIQNIHASDDAAGASISGIYEISGANMFFFNNMISELTNPAAVATLGYDYNMLNGIYIEEGTNFKGFYNNTIYLNSITTAATSGSSAICAYSLTGVDLRNNILINTSTPAGSNGKTVGIRSRVAAYTNYTTNYNDIYVGTPGPVNMIFFNGTAGDQTLAAYKTRVAPNEAQSVTELPPFINVAASPYNLHMKSNVATQCEAGGVIVSGPIPITFDFDGDARFPNAGYPVNPSFSPYAPDLGADEFGGLANDLTPPAIVYTPLPNTISSGARTLYATITDGSGVGGGFGTPVLYWKINRGAYQPVAGSVAGNDTYSFTFGSGIANHDTVYYYVVAQDNAPVPNVGAFPSVGAAGYTTNPPACSTPPVSPSSYMFAIAISGVKHVGVGKDYNTLTAAAADLKVKIMSGPVTLVLDDNTYPGETFPIFFFANPGSSPVNLLTIQPNTGASPKISGSNANGIIIFNGIDYVTVDGSNNGSTTRDLIIENTIVSYNAFTISITNNGGTDPSKNITIKNCVVRETNTSIIAETYDILFNTNGGIAGGGYDKCMVTNNTITRATYGIFVTGSASNVNRDIVISNNTIGSSTPADYILRYGVAIEQSDNTLISGNEIMGPANGTAMQVLFGIYYGGNCSNTKIHQNIIHDWYSMGLGAYGIKCSNENNATPTEIFNNLIYNIKTPGMNPGPSNNNAFGIMVRLGSNIKIWNNSIYLSGPFLNGTDSYAPSSACICLYDAASNNIDIRDNILRNAMTNPSNPAPGSGAIGRAYGIELTGDAGMFSQLDYNDYHIDGYNGAIGQQWAPGGIPVGDYNMLNDWQAFTGKEVNSDTLNPLFVSDIDPMNLHPANPNLNSMGGPKLLDTDLTGATRYNPEDIGAYEWSLAISNYHTLASTAITQTGAMLHGDINTNGEFVNVAFQWGLTTGYGNIATPAPSQVRSVGTLLPVSASIAGLTSNTTYHYRFYGVPVTSGQAAVYGADMTFTTPGVPATVTVTNTISNDTCFNATQTITVAGTPGTFVVTPAGHVTMIAGQNIIFLPGTQVQPGGYLHGYISNQYCMPVKSPTLAEKSVEAESPVTTPQSFFKIYPNPTTGVFTLEVQGEAETGIVNVEIFGMHGDKILSTEISGNGKHELSLAGKPVGMYFIRMISGSKTETSRILKQ